MSSSLSLSGCGQAAIQTKSKTASKAKKVVIQQQNPVKPQKPDEPVSTDETTSESSKDIALEPSPPAPVVQKIHRPSDTRPVYDDAKISARGISKVTAARLILYSDVPAADLKGLPDLAAELYPELERYFGPLPPDREGRPYQMTAFLMADAQRFVDAGLLLEGRIQPHEGWYRGNEFWWNRQPSDYYTRHLLLHEATHCFMHVMPTVDCPPWYVEGMAEWFGTHHRDSDGAMKFGVLPGMPEDFPGWARISVIQQEVAEGRLQDANQIFGYTFNNFQKLPAYAWSWALCHYLNTHPRYQKPFRELAKRMMGGGFQNQAAELFAADLPDLKDEWLLFASQIQYGHDIPRSQVHFHAGTELVKGTASQPLAVSAQQGWQSTRVNLIAGRNYQMQASGRTTLAKTTKPWISEPQGISIRYFGGQPLGRLMGCVRPSLTDTNAKSTRREMLKLIPLGPNTTFVAPHSGTLYLRINDAWNELGDNLGEYQAKIEAK